MNKLYFLDLFCGAGGTSQGIANACAKKGLDYWLTAVNHWEEAIKTHRANHIGSHHETDFFQLNPKIMVPGGKVDVLCASPECIYHSNARGGGPCNEQSRSAAGDLIKWLRVLDVSWLIIENVAEFTKWGPLAKEAGTHFQRWLKQLEHEGYTYEYKTLNSADYGAYTARKRFFLIATKTGKEIVWPAKTHEDCWNPASDIIDWSLDGSSVFTREKPLVRNSMRRVCHGLKKFNGIELDLDYAVECAKNKELPKVKFTEELTPFLSKYNGGAVPRVHSVAEPMRTVDTSNRFALLTPFFAEMYGTSKSRSVRKPLSSVTTTPKSVVCEPFLMPQHQGYDKLNVRPVDKPLPTITTSGSDAVLEPYITKYYGTGTAVSVDQPLGTVTTKDRFGINEPVIKDCSLDVTYRLMEPSELAAAMGFPEDYKFSGTKTAVKKQIGNAVECGQAEALVSSVLHQHMRSA